jgi:hypothetical protein
MTSPCEHRPDAFGGLVVLDELQAVLLFVATGASGTAGRFVD